MARIQVHQTTLPADLAQQSRQIGPAYAMTHFLINMGNARGVEGSSRVTLTWGVEQKARRIHVVAPNTVLTIMYQRAASER